MIFVKPDKRIYNVSEPRLIFTCHTFANPAPTYTWLLPGGSTRNGPILQLSSLRTSDTGEYTCRVNNGLTGVNVTDSKTVNIFVGM